MSDVLFWISCASITNAQRVSMIRSEISRLQAALDLYETPDSLPCIVSYDGIIMDPGHPDYDKPENWPCNKKP